MDMLLLGLEGKILYLFLYFYESRLYEYVVITLQISILISVGLAALWSGYFNNSYQVVTLKRKVKNLESRIFDLEKENKELKVRLSKLEELAIINA